MYSVFDRTLSAIRINTVLVRYGHSVQTKQFTKNPTAKHTVKADISMKTIGIIVQWLGETFGIFRPLVA